MNDCIFCKIVNGEIPSTKIYEDEKVLAFLDINPATKGHSLIIPKKHFRTLTEVDDETLETILPVIKKVAEAIKKATGCEGYNIHQSNESIAGQVVFHVHFHIFPRYKDDNQSFSWSNITYKDGEAQELADKIRLNF